MKTKYYLLLGLMMLFVQSQAQFDFRFVRVSEQTFQAITSPVEEYQVHTSMINVDLGFDLSSYGLKCSKVSVAKGLAHLNFDLNYAVSMLPAEWFDHTVKEGAGRYLVQRGKEGNQLFCRIEFRNLEFEEYPDECFSYQLTIWSDGRVRYHYGSNRLTATHPLSSKQACVWLVEEDYDSTLANPGSEQDYFRTLLNPYGDPQAPQINSVYERKNLNSLPKQNTYYDFTTNQAAGIADERTKLNFRLAPNPASGKCTLEFDAGKVDRVEVFDITGRLMLRKDVEVGVARIELDLKSFRAGSYFVKVSHQGLQLMEETLLVK